MTSAAIFRSMSNGSNLLGPASGNFAVCNFIGRTLGSRNNSRLVHFQYRSITTAQVTERVTNTAKSAQNATRKLLEKITGLRDPIIYNTSVLKEVAKEVYIKENLAPPKREHIEAAKDALIDRFNAGRKLKWGQIWKDFDPIDAARTLVRVVEVAGFFFIGEVIGRRRLVGYGVN